MRTHKRGRTADGTPEMDTPAKRLARLKLQHPRWLIGRNPDVHTVGYVAENRSDPQRVIVAVSVTDLEVKLGQERDRRPRS
jgi:hypothetical protein